MTTRCTWSVCTCCDKIFQIGFVVFLFLFMCIIPLSFCLHCLVAFFPSQSPFSLNISPFLPFPNYWWALCSKIFPAVFRSVVIYLHFFAKPLDGLCLCVFVTEYEGSKNYLWDELGFCKQKFKLFANWILYIFEFECVSERVRESSVIVFRKKLLIKGFG